MKSIQKIRTAQEDDYKTGPLIDYIYLKNYCNMIVLDLSKQETFDTDPKGFS